MEKKDNWWNKVIIDRSQIRLLTRFKDANAFSYFFFIDTKEFLYSRLLPAKTYTILPNQKIFIHPLEIKRQAKKMWSIINIGVTLFILTIYSVMLSQPESRGL